LVIYKSYEFYVDESNANNHNVLPVNVVQVVSVQLRHFAA